MKYLLIINTSEPETVWNALRFGSTAQGRGHETSIFLLGPGVELEGIDEERFVVQKRLAHFLEQGGCVLSCGTCLQHRGMEAAESRPISTMDELLSLSEDADKIFTFD